MIRATVLCDASFDKPRSRRYGFGGWAAWIAIDGQAERVKGFGPIKADDLTNSTEAEVYAALNGIWLARRHGATHVLVRSDCTTVAELIEGKVRSPRLLSIWRRALARPDMQGVILEARHVKGHGEITCRATFVNDWCDRHAKAAMRKQRRKVYGERASNEADRQGGRRAQSG